MSELSLTRIFNPAPGWYRGDFHAHTVHSDGRYSAIEVARMARQEGLDFFTITDHNTLDSFDQFGDDPGLLVIPGVEVTLDVGHWNVFGMQGTPSSAWQEWMIGICGDRMRVSLSEGRTASSVMKEIADQGLFSSINHPFLKPWEWRDKDTDLAYVHSMEVWNDHLWLDNQQATPQAVDYWTRLLNAGIRLTAIGGSDFHFLPGDHRQRPGEYLGKPATWVYAEQLSGMAVLEGLRKGRAHISVGPRLTFQARCAGHSAGIGDSLDCRGGDLELFAEVIGLEGQGSARLILDGAPAESAVITDKTAQWVWQMSLPAGEAHWVRLEVLDETGGFLAITNPIYIHPEQHAIAARFGDFI